MQRYSPSKKKNGNVLGKVLLLHFFGLLSSSLLHEVSFDEHFSCTWSFSDENTLWDVIFEGKTPIILFDLSLR